MNEAKEHFSLFIRPDGSANGYVFLLVLKNLENGKLFFFFIALTRSRKTPPAADLLANYRRFERCCFYGMCDRNVVVTHF